MPQIIRYFLSTFNMGNTQISYREIFPKFKILSQILMALLWTIGDPLGLLGAPQSLKMVKTCLKSSDNPLSIFYVNVTWCSHNEIFSL